MRGYYGLILFVIGVSILTSVLYQNSKASKETRTFSSYTLLTSSWEKYKIRFINGDGRVIDYSQNGITTSEGQSYALLQAVWMDDKQTFDKVWTWTFDNLKRPNDQLFGWRWGLKQNNQYGLLSDGGDNSATDADQDIALALILAGRRWENEKYISASIPIIIDIWNIETDVIGPNRYITAGNWAAGTDKTIINPSYFAPYAWRIFGIYDINHDWNSLIDPAYSLLQDSSSINLNTSTEVGLPPDWITLTKPSGVITPTQMSLLTTDYSFDAMRIPWRITLDYIWNKDTQAKKYLESLKYLETIYLTKDKLPSGFTHEGLPLNQIESPTMYATALGYFSVTNPQQADSIYQNKILKLYSNDTNSFKDDLPYYEANWLWFGTALYLHYLVPFS